MSQERKDENSVTSTSGQIANGVISRIAPNDLVYVELNTDPKARSLSFTPRVVAGYMGQTLLEFGLKPGAVVKVMFDPSSGFVQWAQLQPKTKAVR